METSNSDVKPRSDSEDVNAKPTRAENVVVSVKSVWAIVVAVFLVGGFVLRLSFQVDALQVAQITANREFREAMATVNIKLSELDRVAKLEAKVDSIKENGTDAVKAMKEEFNRMRHDFDVHVAETVTKPNR